MSDLDFLRAHVPGYADYADDHARHDVDKQMRALTGEALAAARERLGPSGPLLERLDGLVFRCEFSDQRLIRAADHADFDGPLIDRVHELDRCLVEAAARLGEVSGDGLGAALDEIARIFDERFGAIADAPPRP